MPLHRSWELVAKEEPDARAQRSRNEKKSVLLGWMEECFCVNCGKPHGMVSKDWAAYVFCLCDDCVGKYGHPPSEFVEVHPDVMAIMTSKGE